MSTKRFTEEQELEIIKDWEIWGFDLGITLFSKNKATCVATMLSVIKKHGAKTQGSKRYSPEETQDLVKSWKKDKLSMTVFCEKYKINHVTMKNILKKNNIQHGVQAKTAEKVYENVKPILGKDVYLNEIPKDGFCKFPKIISTENGINTHEWCGEKSGDSSWCPNHHVVCISKTYSNPNPRCMGYKNFI